MKGVFREATGSKTHLTSTQKKDDCMTVKNGVLIIESKLCSHGINPHTADVKQLR